MAVNEDYLKYVQEQFALFGDIEIKKMFGGIGIFTNGVMFAMIANDTLRFKVDETNRQQYEERDMRPFFSGSKKKGMPYWEVPPDILDDRSLLKEWANQSLKIAQKAAGKK